MSGGDDNPIAFGHRLKYIEVAEKFFKIYLVNNLYIIDQNEIYPYFDATRHVRKILSKPQCPVVALMANAMQGDKNCLTE